MCISEDNYYTEENCNNNYDKNYLVNEKANNYQYKDVIDKKEYKSVHFILKIYNSIFDYNNKQVDVIKPFPIIKENYINKSLLKTSLPNVNTGENSINLGTQTDLLSSNVSNSNILSNIPYNIFKAIDEGSVSDYSDTSSYISNMIVIDLEVVIAEDSSKPYIALKDKNDFSSNNLLSIVDKPHNVKLLYDKTHFMEKNCINNKYCSFDFLSYNKYLSIAQESRLIPHSSSLEFDSNKFKEVSFNINEEALSKINSNTLIVESDNLNQLPFKEHTSFATSKDIIETGN